jgi:hypothetical protein
MTREVSTLSCEAKATHFTVDQYHARGCSDSKKGEHKKSACTLANVLKIISKKKNYD